VPARPESFAEFKARHADGKVLVPNDPTKPGNGVAAEIPRSPTRWRCPYSGRNFKAMPLMQ
jgi:hypothetical protein